jgi:CheY-like chemotaxis protein
MLPVIVLHSLPVCAAPEHPHTVPYGPSVCRVLLSRWLAPQFRTPAPGKRHLCYVRPNGCPSALQHERPPAMHSCSGRARPTQRSKRVALQTPGEAFSVTKMAANKTILCVDDETTGLHVRKLMLQMQGHTVLTAENGPEALALFSSNVIDLVVLDFAMPGMDGGAVADKMKTIKPSVPILMLSAYVDLPAETLSKVDKLVTKGAPPPSFLGAISELLTPGDAGAGSLAT